ncbi:hypothetical protein ACRCUN_32615 [Mycobacterium sp. LTG2003]
MSPQTSTSAPNPVAFGRRHVPGSTRVLQYDLNVVGSGVGDLVSSVGGWLFDRAMAGWNVNVALSEPDVNAALGILGLKTVEPKGRWQSMTGGPEHVAMTLIATDRFDADDDVRLRGLTALRSGAGTLAFWGVAGPGQLGGQVHRAQYRLSAAARAFKAHALAAAGRAAEPVDSVETIFRCGHASRLMDTDLVPY